MKYKCIREYIVNDIPVMKPGDIITAEGCHFNNITKGMYYNNIEYKMIKSYLEPITDDIIPTVKSDADKFKEITEKMCNIFRRKNHDYGNSFEQSLNEEGLAASRIRMGDKWNRFKSLSKGEKAQVNDESLRDTLLDMANYAIMTVMWMDGNVQSM